MPRIALTAHLHPEALDDYLQMHQHIPSELRQAFTQAGIRNYQSYHDGTQIFALYEVDDEVYAETMLAVNPVNLAWEAQGKAYFAEDWRPIGLVCSIE